MRVGNGSKVDAIAVGTVSLQLPSGLVMNLNKCYLVPALRMNIISGHFYCETVTRLSQRIMVVLFL